MKQDELDEQFAGGCCMAAMGLVLLVIFLAGILF